MGEWLGVVEKAPFSIAKLLSRPNRELLSLIAIPVLIIINLFLIIYILVPVFSGNVSSTTGMVNTVNSLFVYDTGKAGVGTGGRTLGATLEVPHFSVWLGRRRRKAIGPSPICEGEVIATETDRFWLGWDRWAEGARPRTARCVW